MFANAHADIVVEQLIEGPGQSTAHTTARLKGNRLRVDVEGPAGPVSSVLDLETGDATTLVHATKSATQLSGARTKELIESLKKKVGRETDAEPVKPVAAGRKEKIGNFNTEVFTWKTANGIQTVWVTKDLPNWAKLRDQLDRISRSLAPEPPRSAAADATALPGVIVKSELDRAGQKYSATVLSIHDEELNPALFETPPDYQSAAAPEKSGTAAEPEPVN